MRSKITVALVIGLCVASIAQDSAEPPGHGAYYKTKDGWQKLEVLTATSTDVRAFSGMTISYREAEAPVQLSDRRPVFYIKTTPDRERLMAVASRSTVIVCLTRRKITVS